MKIQYLVLILIAVLLVSGCTQAQTKLTAPKFTPAEITSTTASSPKFTSAAVESSQSSQKLGDLESKCSQIPETEEVFLSADASSFTSCGIGWRKL